MDRFEMTEKLREKTGVSYEEAKAALETTEWDLLEALVLLEKKKPATEKEAAEAAKKEPSEKAERGVPEQESRRRTYRRAEYRGQGARRDRPKADTAAMRRAVQRVIDFLALLIEKGGRNRLEARTGDRTLVSIPLTVLAAAVIFLFWLTVPMMLLGLVLGVRYRLVGRDVGRFFGAAKDNGK